MSLLSDIEAERRQTGPRCTVYRLLQALPADDADDLRAAIDTITATGGYAYNSNQITAALKKRGLNLTPDTIQRHRRRACQCPD